MSGRRQYSYDRITPTKLASQYRCLAIHLDYSQLLTKWLKIANAQPSLLHVKSLTHPWSIDLAKYNRWLLQRIKAKVIWTGYEPPQVAHNVLRWGHLSDHLPVLRSPEMWMNRWIINCVDSSRRYCMIYVDELSVNQQYLSIDVTSNDGCDQIWQPWNNGGQWVKLWMFLKIHCNSVEQ